MAGSRYNLIAFVILGFALFSTLSLPTSARPHRPKAEAHRKAHTVDSVAKSKGRIFVPNATSFRTPGHVHANHYQLLHHSHATSTTNPHNRGNVLESANLGTNPATYHAFPLSGSFTPSQLRAAYSLPSWTPTSDGGSGKYYIYIYTRGLLRTSKAFHEWILYYGLLFTAVAMT